MRWAGRKMKICPRSPNQGLPASRRHDPHYGDRKRRAEQRQRLPPLASPPLATKNMPNCLGWRRAIEAIGPRVNPRDCILGAAADMLELRHEITPCGMGKPFTSEDTMVRTSTPRSQRFRGVRPRVSPAATPRR